VNLGFIAHHGLWWRGLVIAALLGFVIRPLVVGGLLVPFDLTRRGRVFLMWSGLKGAVPILLASLAVAGGTAYSAEIYGIVFVVVLFSVVVQGSLVPRFAE
jgi:potassium/hydrogen antiporter